MTSTSIDRAPGPTKNFVRGKSGFVPFWPGGLESLAGVTEDVVEKSGQVKGLRTVAPGLSRGLRLPGEIEDPDVVDELDALEQRDFNEDVEARICFTRGQFVKGSFD